MRYAVLTRRTLFVAHTLNKGLIHIWGVNVLDAPEIFLKINSEQQE